MNIQRIEKDTRLSRAITGLSASEIDVLNVSFKKALNREKKNKIKKRKRAEGGGRKGYLRSEKEKLIYILMYIKIYPTYDVLSALIGLNRSECCRWVHRLLPLLEESLGYQVVLPKRQITSLADFEKQCPGIKDIFMDGMERPIQRHGNSKSQSKHYSGKKKQQSRKNIKPVVK